jgi:hypothetical protein
MPTDVGDAERGQSLAVPIICLVLAVGVIAVASTRIAGAFDDPNPSVRCGSSPTPGCVSRVRGVIAPGKPLEGDISVSYDDGTKYETVNLQTRAKPEVGQRVDLEYRGRTLVSVYDRSSGHRYRTDTWPRHWRSVGVALIPLCVGLLLVGVALRTGLRAPRSRPA